MLLDLLYHRITKDAQIHIDEGRNQWLTNQLHAGLATLFGAGGTFTGSDESFSGCILGLARLAQSPVGSPLTKHWSTPLLVSRAALGQISPAAAAARLGVNLLFETLPDGSSPLAGLSFSTPTDENGSVPVLSQHCRLRSRYFGTTQGALRWTCQSRSVKMSLDNLPSVEIPLPLQRETKNSELIFDSYPIAPRWDLPIVEDGAAALLLDRSMVPASNSDKDTSALSLADSLEEAHSLLGTFWPEVIGWIQAMNPAFVALPSAGSPKTHYSGSFGPGIPLYLSRVSNSWFHVEDLVHEVQHQRFNLFLDEADYFPKWHEAEEKFVSPFRLDLRPMRGLHLGLHAFLAVNELRLRALGRVTEDVFSVYDLLKTHRQNVFCYQTATHFESLSEDGRRYYDRVGDLLCSQGKIIESLVSPEVDAAVAADLKRHLQAAATAGHAPNRHLLEGPVANALN